LDAGTYAGQINIASAKSNVSVPVTVTVSAVPQSILLSQTGLTFTAVAGGGTPPPQTFGILNTGQGVMSWSVSSTTQAGGSWLSVTPGSGSTDASSLTVPLVSVTVNAAGLAAGQYSGQIAVQSSTAADSPQFVSIVLNVLPPGSNPGPVVQPTGLIFVQVAGGPAPAPQTFSVSNLTATQSTYTIGTTLVNNAGAHSWLSVSSVQGPVAPSQPLVETVSVDSTGLAPGIYRGILTVAFGDGSAGLVNVLFLVKGSGTASAVASPGKAVSAAPASCTPAKLLPLIITLGSQFSVAAAFPNALTAQVVDDCGNPLLTGTVITSFSNGDAPVAMVSLKNGNWSGTWQVRNGQATSVTITVTALDSTSTISGSATLSGTIENAISGPVMAAGGVLNAASFALGAPLAPGSMVSIFGSGLANGTSSASSLPLPIELAGATVLIGGQTAPVFYAKDGQINAIVPYGLPANVPSQVIVNLGSTYTTPEPVTIASAQPAIFTADGSGSGQAIAVRPNGDLANKSTPSTAGEVLVFYATGLGQTSPPAVAGQAATSSPLQSVANVSLAIGGQPANIRFAGLAPGFTSLYQINATVPAGVQGDTLPVVLSVGGQAAPVVTVSVN
jgi:uncharacterized protein (TIGR03437 family)